MKLQTTEEATNAILRIIEEEALRLGLKPNREKIEPHLRSNELMVSLKQNDRVFRIRLKVVRDEYREPLDFLLGTGYIQTEWDMTLEPENRETAGPPYCWKLTPRDESTARASHPRILEEQWLRRLIRKKLAAVHD